MLNFRCDLYLRGNLCRWTGTRNKDKTDYQFVNLNITSRTYANINHHVYLYLVVYNY